MFTFDNFFVFNFSLGYELFILTANNPSFTKGGGGSNQTRPQRFST